MPEGREACPEPGIELRSCGRGRQSVTAGAEIAPDEKPGTSTRDDIQVAVGVDITNGCRANRLGRQEDGPPARASADVDRRPAAGQRNEPDMMVPHSPVVPGHS